MRITIGTVLLVAVALASLAGTIVWGCDSIIWSG